MKRTAVSLALVPAALRAAGCRAALLAAGCLAAPLAAGCGPSAEKVEAQRVLHAIDAVRDSDAPPSARLDLVKQLEADKATGRLAVAARDACAKAYRPLFEATVAMEEVKRAKEEGTVGPEVFGALEQAGAAIDSANALMPACEKAHDELARAARSVR